MTLSNDPHVTKHASKRIRERVGLNKKSTKALALKALKEGLTRKNCRGHLRKYIDGVFFRTKKGNNIRVLNDKIFIFKDNILITVMNLPQDLAKIAMKVMSKLKKRKTEKNEQNLL